MKPGKEAGRGQSFRGAGDRWRGERESGGAHGKWWREKAGGKKRTRRLRKSNSKFKWRLSWPRIQGIFTNVVLLSQSKSSIIPIHPWGNPYGEV